MSLKITIITACLNSVDVIQTALESVLIQTWTDLEYLVVDGGSTDGTLDVIRAYELRFCGRMRWASEPDRGFYDAMNKGIRLATGDIVGLLNADDFYVHEHVLERVAGIFSNVGSTPNEQIDAVYADVRFVSASNLQKEIRHYSGRYWQPWMLRWGSTPPPSTFFCRRKCFEDLGGYKIDYKISADHELLIRFLWNASIKTHYIPEIIINMRRYWSSLIPASTA